MDGSITALVRALYRTGLNPAENDLRRLLAPRLERFLTLDHPTAEEAVAFWEKRTPGTTIKGEFVRSKVTGRTAAIDVAEQFEPPKELLAVARDRITFYEVRFDDAGLVVSFRETGVHKPPMKTTGTCSKKCVDPLAVWSTPLTCGMADGAAPATKATGLVDDLGETTLVGEAPKGQYGFWRMRHVRSGDVDGWMLDAEPGAPPCLEPVP
jgi:hypothetical protein